MGRASHGPTATTSGGTASGRRRSPKWYNPEKYGAGWIPLMRRLDNQMKTAKTGPYAKKEKLKIKPAPTTTTSSGSGTPAANSTPSGSGGTTTIQDMQIDPKKDDQTTEGSLDKGDGSKGAGWIPVERKAGGGGGQKPPKKKKPPKKDSGTPTDTSGGGSSAGAANL